jgi:putative inorganic carbon (HCO3(-)) transporter
MFIRTGREDFWRKTISVIRQYPALGIGLNTYSKLSNTEEFDWIGGYPHNCYLQMAAETGVLGLAAFLWILFVLFLNAMKSLRSIQDRYFEILLLGSMAGAAGFLIHSFVDTGLYSVKLGNLFWIMMGFMTAMQIIAKQSEQK